MVVAFHWGFRDEGKIIDRAPDRHRTDDCPILADRQRTLDLGAGSARPEVEIDDEGLKALRFRVVLVVSRRFSISAPVCLRQSPQPERHYSFRRDLESPSEVVILTNR